MKYHRSGGSAVRWEPGGSEGMKTRRERKGDRGEFKHAQKHRNHTNHGNAFVISYSGRNSSNSISMRETETSKNTISQQTMLI